MRAAHVHVVARGDRQWDDYIRFRDALREDADLRRLPVVILTTSKDEEDRLGSYDLGANAYIMKPVGFHNFSQAVRTINLFWELVELPEWTNGLK